MHMYTYAHAAIPQGVYREIGILVPAFFFDLLHVHRRVNSVRISVVCVRACVCVCVCEEEKINEEVVRASIS